MESCVPFWTEAQASETSSQKGTSNRSGQPPMWLFARVYRFRGARSDRPCRTCSAPPRGGMIAGGAQASRTGSGADTGGPLKSGAANSWGLCDLTALGFLRLAMIERRDG